MTTQPPEHLSDVDKLVWEQTRRGQPTPAPMRNGDDAELDDEPKGDDTDGKRKTASMATTLVETARSGFVFGVTNAGEPFAVPRAGPKVTSLLRGGKPSLRSILARNYFVDTGRAATQAALADALLVLEGLAYDTDEAELHLRVAEHDGAFWLDLGDPTGRAVRITGDGWTVEDRAPVLFRRSALTSPLPTPTPGGDLGELWERMNVEHDDRPLIAAWIVAALHPNIPHPILDLEGEQGNGKTTVQRTIVSVIDPSPVPSRKPPRDADSWVTAASGSWVVGLDNLSTVPDWLSDSLCRAVTGDGDVRRRLYTDGDLAVFAYRRSIIITGIDLGALNGDLAERLLPIRLASIDGANRLEESELWPGWEAAHPRILGAVLDLAARVARVVPSVHLDTKPRMADFAMVLAAVDVVLGTDGLGRYLDKQGSLASESLTNDSFIMALLSTLNSTFTGTSAELLNMFTYRERPPKDWPRNAREVTVRLRRQAPTMRKSGWQIDDDGGANKTNAVRWNITRPEMSCISSSLSSPSSPPQVTRDNRTLALLAQASQASNNLAATTRDDEEASQARHEYTTSQGATDVVSAHPAPPRPARRSSDVVADIFNAFPGSHPDAPEAITSDTTEPVCSKCGAMPAKWFRPDTDDWVCLKHFHERQEVGS